MRSKTYIDFISSFGEDHVVGSSSKKQKDVVSMDGSAFSIFNEDIGESRFSEYLLNRLNKQQYNLAYVCNTPADANQIFWMDIDKKIVPLKIIQTGVKQVIASKYQIDENEINKEMYTLSNAEGKYHIFIPVIYCNRRQRTDLWHAINRYLRQEIADVKATNIRFPGFNKYDRTSRKFTTNRYKSIDGLSWKKFYSKVNLLRYEAKSGYYPKIKLSLRRNKTNSINISNNTSTKPRYRNNTLTQQRYRNNVSTQSQYINGKDEDDINETDEDDTNEDCVEMDIDDFDEDVDEDADDGDEDADEDAVEDNDNSNINFNIDDSFLSDLDDDDRDLLNIAEQKDGEYEQIGTQSILEEEEKQDRASSVQALSARASDAVRNQIAVRYSFIQEYLKAYPIKTIKNYSSSVLFGFDKSREARTCPFADRIHSKSNGYLIYRSKAGRLERCCNSQACKNKRQIIWTRSLNTNLPGATDVDITQAFEQCYQDIIYSDTEVGAVGFYIKFPEFWKYDKNNKIICKRLQIDFVKKIDETYSKEIAQCEEEKARDELMQKKKEIIKILKMSRYVTGVLKCLMQWLDTPDIKWNNNPNKIVFSNGVLDIETGEFGNTEPGEYINDNKKMGVPYVPRNPDYIQKELKEGIFNKVFPDPDIRRSWLQYMSIAFEGRPFKKCCINHGRSGNNGKSKICEFIIHIFGSYAYMANSRMLLKGKKDAKSFANLHLKRFVVFEEPDDTKAIDTSIIKLIVGGVETLCARILYSMRDQIQLCCKCVININDLPGLHVDKATMARIVYYPWNTEFVLDEDEVDEEKHRYLANDKYADRRYWQLAGPQLVHLLLDHYKEFRSQNRTLYIPPKIQHMTRRFCESNDPFMNWFTANFELLRLSPENNRIFITMEEIKCAFASDPEKDKIMPNRFTTVGPFIKKMIDTKPTLKDRYKTKHTNWRITLEQRKYYKGTTDNTALTGQYAGHVLCAAKPKTNSNTFHFPEDESPQNENDNTVTYINALMRTDINNISDGTYSRLLLLLKKIKRKRNSRNSNSSNNNSSNSNESALTSNSNSSNRLTLTQDSNNISLSTSQNDRSSVASIDNTSAPISTNNRLSRKRRSRNIQHGQDTNNIPSRTIPRKKRRLNRNTDTNNIPSSSTNSRN